MGNAFVGNRCRSCLPSSPFASLFAQQETGRASPWPPQEWQLRHSWESLAFIFSQTCTASFSRFAWNFSGCVDGTHEMVQQLIQGKELGDHLRYPFLRHVTVRADRPHSLLIFVMNGLLIFRNHVGCHLMAHRGTEMARTRIFHECIESPPRK